MSSRLFLLSIITLVLGAGCGASFDENGRIMDSRVWFDQYGVAYTPTTQEGPVVQKLRPTQAEADAIIVPPHSALAVARVPVTWAQDDQLCWACDGAKRVALHDAFDEERGKYLSNTCDECGGRGVIRYGGICEFPR